MNQPEEALSNAAEGTLPWSAEDGPGRDISGVTLGDFQVERLLGRGGMGEVYLARQISLQRPVALKVLRPDLLTKPVYLSRFEAEATAVARLNHPNIVHIYTLGSIEGIRFIAMEYVQGTNLRDYINKKGALEFPLALSIMKQAGVAVGAAGELGLIHRDIKPENLLLTRKGQVKVADFGLCRDLDAGPMNLTQTGLTLGTPLYMSPEQAQGHALDHRSDLYSLGVTFYHTLAGVPPFKADSPLALALKHVKDTPASLAVHRPEIPAELDRLVLKLMAKSPDDRYQSAAEMLRDLAKVREAMHAPSMIQPVADVPGVTTTQQAAERPSRSSGALAAVSSEVRTLLHPSKLGPGPLGTRAKVALLAAGLILGGLLGWFNRTEDLLAAKAGSPETMPGLWIALRWEEIPTAASAQDQYHYAQLRASKDDEEAAWLAVPGHFPSSREWSARAYTQLARRLLLRHDADRLRVFAAEIERWDGAQTHEKELANVIRAGVKALAGDLDGVLDDFRAAIEPIKLTDPALLELCLEVTDQAEKTAERAGSPPNPLARRDLRAIQQRLLFKLYQTELQDPLFLSR
jgi:serine/threonine-protein kinase